MGAEEIETHFGDRSPVSGAPAGSHDLHRGSEWAAPDGAFILLLSGRCRSCVFSKYFQEKRSRLLFCMVLCKIAGRSGFMNEWAFAFGKCAEAGIVWEGVRRKTDLPLPWKKEE